MGAFIITPIVLYFAIFYFSEEISNASNFLKRDGKYFKTILAFLSVAYIAFIYFVSTNYRQATIFVATFTTAYFFSQYFISKHSKYTFLFFPFALLILANTFTSDLARDDMAIICIPALIFTSQGIYNFLVARKIPVFPLYLAATFLVTGSALSRKIIEPWSWFGANQSSISYANYIPPYPEMAGIKVDKKTYEVLNSIKHNIDKYSTTAADVLLYPNIPFFYILHNKIPPFGVPVYWFDTSSDFNQASLLSNIEKSKPNLVIVFDPPYFAYEAHSTMKKKEVEQLKFINYMNALVGKGVYKLVDYIIFENTLDTNIQKQLFKPNIYTVINLNSKNTSLESLKLILREKNISFENISNLSSLSEKVSIGDRIQISTTAKDIPSLVDLIGPTDKANDSFYTLKVFKLN